MAIARMLPVNLFFIPAFSKLHDSSKLAYIGLLLHADDEGRGFANTRTLSRAIDSHDSQVEASLKQLHEQGLILLYEVENEQYYQITSWSDMMQGMRYKHVSLLPPPPASEHAESNNTQPATMNENHSADVVVDVVVNEKESNNNNNNSGSETEKDLTKAQTPNEGTLITLLECSAQAARELIAEFPNINIAGECWAASDYSKSRKKKLNLATFRNWLAKTKEIRGKTKVPAKATPGKKESPYKAKLEAAMQASTSNEQHAAPIKTPGLNPTREGLAHPP